MKRYALPIQVNTRDGRPASFRRHGRTCHVVELLDHWCIRTRWWGREEDRRYFQVLARPLDTDADRSYEGVYELCRSNGCWRIERIVD